MALGANSYGTVAEVLALTRIYLRGQSAYNSTTRPTLTEVETFIDRTSGVLNLALATAGFTVPVAQADAKLACDDWVVRIAAAYVEAAQPWTGADPEEASILPLPSLSKALEFVQAMSAGFVYLGVSQPGDDSNALIFTGQTAQADRADPDDDTLEQPHFKRGQFDS